MTDITPTIVLLITLCTLALVIATVLMSKKPADGEGLTLPEWVENLVGAAEQIFVGSGRGKEKLSYVAAALERLGYVFDVDDIYDATRALIEAAVRAINKG